MSFHFLLCGVVLLVITVVVEILLRMVAASAFVVHEATIILGHLLLLVGF